MSYLAVFLVVYADDCWYSLLSLVLILVLFLHNVSIMSPLQRLKRMVGRFGYFKRSEYDKLLQS